MEAKEINNSINNLLSGIDGITNFMESNIKNALKNMPVENIKSYAEQLNSVQKEVEKAEKEMKENIKSIKEKLKI